MLVRELPALAKPFPSMPDPVSFTSSELSDVVDGALLHEGGAPIHGGVVDSRRVERGNAFFALAGERTDGHNFLVDAARRGAAALVVARPPNADQVAELDAHGEGGPALVLVADPLAALQAMAGAHRSRCEPLVVCITGSLGKTSTKEQVAEVLAQRWRVMRNAGNENNEIGLPLTLLRLSPADEVAVLEMGMYQPGDIAQLAELARPGIGVVTAVRGSHLERAGSIEAIERGKRELVEALPTGGTAVLNADDPRVADMAAGRGHDLAVLRYGFSSAADVSAIDIESRATEGMSFRLVTPAGAAEVKTPALGRHSVHNALAAAAVGLAAGMALAEIVAGLERPFAAAHRTTLVRAGQWQLLDDTYNAAPDSMIAALNLLATLPGRHVAVLGEMLELGPDSDAAHEMVGAHAARTADVLLVVGPMAERYAHGAAGAIDRRVILRAATRDEALALLDDHLRPGDVVLLKASRGAAFDLLVDDLVRLANAEPVG
ncbi:UDP-N-acetylmuramoyl-tripeptide--D-alanyl-D-alanine ligase [soil metagenome]